jgi:hypothetical protein
MMNLPSSYSLLDFPDAKPEPAFAGWRRLRGLPWAKVCEGTTQSDCMRQLLDIGCEIGGNGESIVLAANVNPNYSRRSLK